MASSPAPAMVLFLHASYRSCSTTQPPLAVLIRKAVGFIISRRSLFTIPRVIGVFGTCRVCTPLSWHAFTSSASNPAPWRTTTFRLGLASITSLVIGVIRTIIASGRCSFISASTSSVSKPRPLIRVCPASTNNCSPSSMISCGNKIFHPMFLSLPVNWPHLLPGISWLPPE